MTSFILIGVAAYGKAVAIIETVTVMGGIIVCGCLLLILALVGLVGTINHHQVMLFFVSFHVMYSIYVN
jgi:tetraspanin-13/31